MCKDDDASYLTQGGYNGYFLRNVVAVKDSWVRLHTKGDGKSQWPHVRLPLALLLPQTL